MAIDMKPIIVDAVCRLIFEKNKKRITVKDIAEECNITRQTFYYHFADIPELLQWVIQQKTEDMKAYLGERALTEDVIKLWLIIAVNLQSYVKKATETNYGAEVKQMMFEHMKEIFNQIAEKSGVEMDPFERDFCVRYHCYATMGLLENWTKEDSDNVGRIAHDIYLMVSGEGCSL